jgi:hypothetical protein
MKGNKSWLLAIIVPVCLIGIFGYAVFQTQAADEVPLPKDINIVSPSPDLPKEIAAFAGKWQGTWIIQRGRKGEKIPREAVLIVEEIDKQEAKIIYAFGPFSGVQELKGWYKRFKAKVIPGATTKIEFITKDQSEFSFEMQKDLNSLGAHYKSGRMSEKHSTGFKRFD